MKITCEIIKDLLPLYCDGVCSEESNVLVEEHLTECDKCREDVRLMKEKINAVSVFAADGKAVKAARAARKKGKRKAFVCGCFVLLLLIAGIIAGVCTYHLCTSSDENNSEILADMAENYLSFDELHIIKSEKRGNYLAALLRDNNGNTCMCVYNRDKIFKNRWYASGGKHFIEEGTVEGWNYGSPQGETVLIFGGVNLPDEVRQYTFTNDGITYICPVENGQVLDIFIVQDCGDINGAPYLLDSNGKRLN